MFQLFAIKVSPFYIIKKFDDILNKAVDFSFRQGKEENQRLSIQQVCD